MQNEYHVWLLPDKKTRAPLKKIIDRLSRKYNAPFFEPHVSLLVQIPQDENREKELVEKTKRLANQTKPIAAVFSKVEHMDDFVRCVFIRVKDSKELFDCRAKSEAVFGRSDKRGFMPHFTMIYGDFDLASKQPMIQAAQSQMPEGGVFDKLALLKNTPQHMVWKTVAEFKLAK
ncbi:MAG: 2'-5' RNA ligase family protein [Candidatus Micrarchaeota archaeon]